MKVEYAWSLLTVVARLDIEDCLENTVALLLDVDEEAKDSFLEDVVGLVA